MTETNKQPMTEAGRSMVEMLGVLAVIGVLSIGGIAGYNLGMEKQRANELLEASLQRAYTVSAQMLSGRNTSLVEFNKDTQKAGGTFQEDVEEQYMGEIGIKIHAVNQNVCKALVRSITDTSPLRGISFTGTESDITEADCQESNDLTLYYNENMSMTGDVQFVSKDQANTDPECEGVTCGDGLTCFHGECKCSGGTLMCGYGDDAMCCAEGTYCAQGADASTYTCATPVVEDSGCTSNSDCADDQYCEFSSGGDCTGPINGSCATKGTLENDFTPYTISSTTIYKSAGKMNWWNAQNLCQAHGKQMVTMADLGISDTGSNTTCYFDSKKTTYISQPCICAGDEDCTRIATELYTIGTTGWFWLGDNCKSSSCYARVIFLNNASVRPYGRANYVSYALCR